MDSSQRSRQKVLKNSRGRKPYSQLSHNQRRRILLEVRNNYHNTHQSSSSISPCTHDTLSVNTEEPFVPPHTRELATFNIADVYRIRPTANNNIEDFIAKENNTFSLRIASCCSVPTKIYTKADFRRELAETFIHQNINHQHGDAILKVLKKHECHEALPKSTKHLLQTPRNPAIIHPVDPGEYLHIGLQNAIISSLRKTVYDSLPQKLEIDISTDGGQLNRDGILQIWPIQIKISNIPDCQPEIVGVYSGKKKPSNAVQFFSFLVDEVRSLHTQGGIKFENQRIPFSFRTFIADAPARAFVLNHHGHNSTVPCSKCKLIGASILIQGRRSTVFLGTNFPKRENSEYYQCRDGSHHNEGSSCLKDLGILPVTHVPFDYMHLVCLGVMKKILEAVVNGNHSRFCKLSKQQITLASERLNYLQSYCPREFSRHPESLIQFSEYKATEYRQLLLYTGIVVFSRIFNDALYQHFLLLHSAMRILLNSSSSKRQIECSRTALNDFINICPDIYGLKFMSYNIHGLSHLVDDYENFGALDSISCFPFENNMRMFHILHRKPGNFLQQVHRRLAESSNIIKSTTSKSSVQLTVSLPHNNGPLCGKVPLNVKQYRSVTYKKLYFSLDRKNNTCILHHDEICTIENIIIIDNQIYLVVKLFQTIEPFYDIGLTSDNFGVFKCCGFEQQLNLIPITRIRSKGFRMPLWEIFNENDNNQNILLPESYVVAKLLE